MRGVGLLVGLGLLLAATACTPRASEEGAMTRGDEAWAQGEMEEALAEYRLALRSGGESDPEVLLRTAHAFARLGRLDEAVEHYRMAIQFDGEVEHQAVADLVRVAREAAHRGDAAASAMAMEAATGLRPGIVVPELSLPLARHFARSGQFGQALPFFQKAMAGAGAESGTELVFELAMAYEEVGDCQRALLFLEEFRERAPRERATEVAWHMGSCSFELARERRREGDLDEALRLVETTVTLGEPQNIQARAWFEMGEILEELGDCTGAQGAYEQVRQAEQGAGGTLVDRAQQRIDAIRFGDGRGGPGRCG
ncbi:MAG: tetratricopeptide repeat protein [Gemmatimonadota bacterium]